MRYLSLFSGIEAATQAWAPLGWECVAVAENDKFPAAVLAARHPEIPNLGDVTKITSEQIAALGPIDLVVAGSPCQDLSVAGDRAGLAGSRSGLFHEQMRIFHAARHFCGARWLLWENVPGAFSSNKGRDFARVVADMAGLEYAPVPAAGWGNEGVAVGHAGLVEWCVLDSQWFGVPQRRKRLFALLDTGNWPDRGPVLLEPEMQRGDPPTRDRPWEEAASRPVEGLALAFGGNNQSGPIEVATALSAHGGAHGRQDFESETFVVAFNWQNGGGYGKAEEGLGISDDHTGPILRKNVPAVAYEGLARRLTPTEAERLQGFPDGYTAITYKGKPAPDGPRYKALGNSMTVPVMRWIGERLALAEAAAPKDGDLICGDMAYDD